MNPPLTPLGAALTDVIAVLTAAPAVYLDLAAVEGNDAYLQRLHSE